MIWMVQYYKLAKHWRTPVEQARKTVEFTLERLIAIERQVREDHKAFHLLGMNPTLTEAERISFDLLDWWVLTDMGLS